MIKKMLITKPGDVPDNWESHAVVLWEEDDVPISDKEKSPAAFNRITGIGNQQPVCLIETEDCITWFYRGGWIRQVHCEGSWVGVLVEQESSDFKAVVASMKKAVDRRNEEASKLTKQGAMADLLQQQMDDHFSHLNYLCNFTSVVDHHGRKHDIQVAIEKLKSLMEATYNKMTGKRYVPEICRQVRYGKKEAKADPHKLPDNLAWLVRLRKAKDSVEMSNFAANEIAAYVDNIRKAAWIVVRALEEAGDQTDWSQGDETDRVYPWYEIEPLKKAVLEQR